MSKRFVDADFNKIQPLLDTLIAEITPVRSWLPCKLSQFDSGKALAKQPLEQSRLMLLEVLERTLLLEQQIIELKIQQPGTMPWGGCEQGELLWNERQVLIMIVKGLLAKKLPLQSNDVVVMLDWISSGKLLFDQTFLPLAAVTKMVDEFEKDVELCSEHFVLLERFHGLLAAKGEHKKFKPLRKTVEMLLEGRPKFAIEPGEAWSDRALLDLNGLSDDKQAAWQALIELCLNNNANKPSKKWLNDVNTYRHALGGEAICKLVLPWLVLVEVVRTDTIVEFDLFRGDPNLKIIEPHQNILRGLVWLISIDGDASIAKALSQLALSCFTKIPGQGARILKLGNACVYGLSLIGGNEALVQLTSIKSQVILKNALKSIDKAILDISLI